MRFFTRQLAIDLGSASMRAYAPKKGFVVHEPAHIALDMGRVTGIGRHADEFAQTSVDNTVIRPIRRGLLTDDRLGKELIRYCIVMAYGHEPRLHSLKLVLSIVPGANRLYQHALIRAGLLAGAGHVCLVESDILAAIGVGLDRQSGMIVDIGAGTTTISVISFLDIVYRRTLELGGDDMTAAIRSYAERRHSLRISTPVAELAKITCGSLRPNRGSLPPLPQLTFTVKGVNCFGPFAGSVVFTDSDVRSAILPIVDIIVHHIGEAIAAVGPSFQRDIYDLGIFLTGGGSLLKQLGEHIHQEIGCPALVDEHSVVLGASRLLGNFGDVMRLRLSDSDDEFYRQSRG